MSRRDFLTKTLAAPAIAAFASRLSAQGMPGMHDMSHGMSMGAMGMQHRMPMMGQSTDKLAGPTALASGATLRQFPRLANQSKQPGQFRATLTAQPRSVALLANPTGPATEMWLYNEDTVAPLIDVFEGDRIEITFVNHLPQPSTIHWHGLPVPSDQDGNPDAMVEPGGTRVYTFTLPLGSAGTYWYHPHPHRLSSEQVFRGLAGPIIVRAKNDPLATYPERHLFISDLKLLADGVIPPNTMMDWMNGREGQYVLLNGQHQPQIRLNGNERWRIWNACNARYVRLSLNGHAFSQVGTDGGLLTHPANGLKDIVLAPAERVELIVSAPPQPASFLLTAAPYDRKKMTMGHGSPSDDPAIVLAQIKTSNAQPLHLPDRLRNIAPLGKPTATKKIVFSEKMNMLAMGMNHDGFPSGMEFLLNGRSFAMGRIDQESRKDEVELWEIVNHSDMDHPFHIHGAQFQIVEREHKGQITPEPILAWKDTANVRPDETVRLKIVQTLTGKRMYHCHILEHEDLGMMGIVNVV